MRGNTFGNFLTLTTFGESHGVALGAMSRAHPLVRGTIDPLSAFLRIAAFVGLPQVLLIVRGFER